MKAFRAFALAAGLILGLVPARPVLGQHELGTPPLLRVKPGLFDQSETRSLGLALLPGQHALLYRASAKGMKYSHHAHLGMFKDSLYAMWSTGPADEDSAGQHVVYSRSKDGITWSAPLPLVSDPDGSQGPLRATAGGWWVQADRLVAFYTTFDAFRPGQKWSDHLRLEARTSTDGQTWSAPQLVLENFMINEAPRRLPSGRLLMTGEDKTGRARLLISDAPDGIKGWRDTTLPLPPHMFSPNEPTWFARADGKIVMLFRDDNGSKHLYASLLNDAQTSWSMPRQTAYPDSIAKARSGNLPDGTTYLIGNPSLTAGRTVLTLGLSRDGQLFDRAVVLRRDPPRQKYQGKCKTAGFQYPNSLVFQGRLYVIYSVNKEDVMVTRIDLPDGKRL